MLLVPLSPRTRGLSQKLTCPHLFKKFPAFSGTLWFIAAFTRAPPFHPQPDRSSLCPPSHVCKIHFNIILRWVLQVVSQLTPCVHLSSPHTCYISCQTQLLVPLPDLIYSLVYEEVRAGRHLARFIKRMQAAKFALGFEKCVRIRVQWKLYEDMH